MSDFFEDFSDGIEDDAGGLAAMGGLAALSNQRASLKKLSAIREQLEKAQAASAKTEKERLAIEKKRLALEQAQKNTADAVRELRLLMADADSLLEKMSQMVAVSSGRGDTYNLDLTRTAALVQVKLELVEKNSEVLSDLADLKEQRRLKSYFEKQLSELAALKRLPENPLSFVEEEVFDQLQHIWSAFVPVEELSNERALKGEGGLKALDSTGYLISEAKLLNLKKRLTKALERLDQVEIQSEVAGSFTNDHFEETKILWGQFYFLKGKKPDLDFSLAVDYLKRVIEDPELKLQMEGVGADALVAIESHITCARDQDAMLEDAAHRISLGDFDLARSVDQIPKAERYTNPLFAKNRSRLEQLDAYQDCFFNQTSFSETHKADLYKLLKRTNRVWEKLKIGQWPNDSDLKQRISKNKKAILGEFSKRKRNFNVVAALVLIIAICGIIFASTQSERRERAEKAAREAKIKATEAIQEKKKAAEAARKAAQAEVKAAEAARKAAAVRLIDEVGAARKAAEAEMKAAEPQASASHSDVGTKFAKAMTSIMDGMGSITDLESAEAFVKTMEGAITTTLKEVVAAAEALDPPTDEEKEAMKAIKEGFEGKSQAIGQKMFQMMAENPDAEAIGAVLMESLNSPQMKEMSDKLDAIYGLED